MNLKRVTLDRWDGSIADEEALTPQSPADAVAVTALMVAPTPWWNLKR